VALHALLSVSPSCVNADFKLIERERESSVNIRSVSSSAVALT